MQPRTAFLLAAGVAAAVGTSTWPATRADERATAATIAARVQSFYAQSATFEGRFLQTYYNRLYGRYERSRGELAVQTPAKVRFDYAPPHAKIIAANDRELVMWEPGDDGGPGQYVRGSIADSSLPAVFSFLAGGGRLGETYRVRLLDAGRYDYTGHVLELRPRTADPRYRRVLLYVDGTPTRAGLVQRIRIDDHDGNRNKFELSNLRFNRPIASSRFAFTPPAGARLVRM
jgi:outer membrane lipoprotein carrier protein